MKTLIEDIVKLNITGEESISINRAFTDINDLAGLLRRVARQGAPAKGNYYFFPIKYNLSIFPSFWWNVVVTGTHFRVVLILFNM